jgi:hypothetical protein
VKGLCKKLKQPLCYFQLSASTTSAKLSELILDCITGLQEVNIPVKVVVYDQGAKNRGMF